MTPYAVPTTEPASDRDRVPRSPTDTQAVCQHPDVHAWSARAAELGRLTFDHLIVRTDRYGKYGPDGRAWTYPSAKEKDRPGDPLTADRLARHYRGEPWMTVGSLTLNTAGMGREVVLDIDAHDGQPFDAAANQRYAGALWRRCHDLGLVPLVYASNGKGGSTSA